MITRVPARHPAVILMAAATLTVLVDFHTVLQAQSSTLSAEEFLFSSRAAIDVDRSYEQYRSTFGTFLPYDDFRALILGEHWQPTAGGQVSVPTEEGPVNLDISSTDLGFIWVLDRASYERSYVAVLGALSGNSLGEGETQWEYRDGIVGFELELQEYGNLVAGQFISHRPIVAERADGELVFATEQSNEEEITTEETQYTFVDLSAYGLRVKGYGDWSSGTIALLDLSFSFGPPGVDELLMLFGSSVFTEVRSGRLYGGVTEIPLTEGLSLGITVEATGGESLESFHDGSIALELENRPYDWVGFNFNVGASMRIDDEYNLLPGAKASLAFPRLFYNTQIELGISYDYVDVVRRIPRENEFSFLIGFNTIIVDG